MLPGLDPKKMQAMMRQMGISQEEVSAEKVTIEKSDGSRIIITNPSVTKIKMHGQETFQIAGEIQETTGFSEEDIKTVMEKTNASREKTIEILEKTGDLAEAILELSE
jgi:nascent polypeptide-associated complex subunit alpha